MHSMLTDPPDFDELNELRVVIELGETRSCFNVNINLDNRIEFVESFVVAFASFNDPLVMSGRILSSLITIEDLDSKFI